MAPEPPGRQWQAVIVLFALAVTSSSSIAGGGFTLWSLPIVAAGCALLVALVGLQEASTRPRTWGLTARQRVLFALLVCAFIGFGPAVWFSHEGAGREAHLLVGHIFTSLIVFISWIMAIANTQNGSFDARAVRVKILVFIMSALALFNFTIASFQDELNNFSTVLSTEYTANVAALLFIILLILPMATRKYKILDVSLALMVLVWSVLIGVHHQSNALSMLPFAALVGLILRFPNHRLAAAYWVVLLAAPVIRFGITSPMLLINAMAATIVFAGSYGLFRILEAYAEQREAREEASGPAAQPGQATEFLDRRSVWTGIAVAAGVALIGGALLYYDYIQAREKIQERAHAVAERLTDLIQIRLQADQQLSHAMLRAGLEQVEARLLKFEGFEVLSARLQGVLILALLAGIGTAFFAANRRRMDLANAALFQFKHTLDQTHDAVFMIDAETLAFTYVNQGAVAELGYSQAELLRKHPYDIKPDYPEPKFRKLLAPLLDGSKTSIRFETVHRRQDGSEFPVEAYLQLVVQDDGAPYFLNTVIDITERKAAEVELRDNELKYRSIMQASPSAIIVADKSGHIIEWNAASERYFGYAVSEAIGQRISLITPPSQRDAHQAGLARYLETGERKVIGKGAVEVSALHKDGYEFPVEMSIEEFSNDEQPYFTASFYDLTERKAVEVERETLRARENDNILAIKQREATSQFLVTMSHEIRTPLNALVNTASLIKADGYERVEKRNLEVIETSASHLLSLVNDVLQFSKIEAGELKLEVTDFLLLDLLKEIYALFSGSAQIKDVELHVSEPNLSLRVPLKGDAIHLRQMLSNLVSNAIKFTPRGGMVEINVDEIEASAPGSKRIRFFVQDNGIGIAAENLDKLFKPFSQVQSYQQRDQGGTGLGLSIVKQMAEQMGGTVGASSEPGKGSKFWIEVELLLADAERKSNAKQAGSANQFVLGLWGLSAAQHRSITTHTAEFGWQTRTFSTADEVRQSTEVASNVALVVSAQAWSEDAGAMPERLALISPPRTDTSILGLELFDAVNEACIEYGCDMSYLLDRTTITFGGPPWLAGVKVLAVDDQNLNLTVLGRVLERAGAICLKAGSGKEALEVVKERLDEIDVVLMDLQMPVMDGCEATIAIRKLKGAKSLPILALTAGATTTEQERAIASGMNDFCIKPAQPADIIRTIRKHVERYRKRPVRFFQNAV